VSFADAIGVKKKSTLVAGNVHSLAVLELALAASLCRPVVGVFVLNLHQQVPIHNAGQRHSHHADK